jgi:WD40 repeat protein
VEPRGDLRVSGSHLEVPAARETAVLKGHEAGIESVTFTPDGGAIVSSASDGTVRIWDFRRAPAIADSVQKPRARRLAQRGEWRAAPAVPMHTSCRPRIAPKARSAPAGSWTVDQCVAAEPDSLTCSPKAPTSTIANSVDAAGALSGTSTVR